MKDVTKRFINTKKDQMAFKGCIIEEHDLGDKLKYVLRNDEFQYRQFIYVDKKYENSTYSISDLLEAYKMDKQNHVRLLYRKAGYTNNGVSKIQPS